MKFITRRREIDAFQVPPRFAPPVEFVKLSEFLDRFDVAYKFDTHNGPQSVRLVVTDKTGEWMPEPLDWLVADPTSENDPITLYTNDEFTERFLDVTSGEELAETKALATRILSTALQTNFGADYSTTAGEIVDVLDENGCLAYDDARDLADTIIPMRDELIRSIVTVWNAMWSTGDPEKFAQAAVGTLIDMLHGRKWETSATGPHLHVSEVFDETKRKMSTLREEALSTVPNEDAFAATEAAVNAYHEQHGRPELGPLLGWFLVRDYETAIAIVTSSELPRKQLSAMVHETSRVVDRGEFS